MRQLSFLAVVMMTVATPLTFAADGIAIPPMLRFTSPSSAEVVWESSRPGSGAVAMGGTPKLGTVTPAVSDGLQHAVTLTDLEPGQTYYYKVGTTIDGKRKLSPLYEFSTALNFSVPTAPRKRAEQFG